MTLSKSSLDRPSGALDAAIQPRLGWVLWMAVMVVVLPLLFLAFLRNGPLRPPRLPELRQQNRILKVAIVLEGLSLVSLLGPRWVRTRTPTFPLLIAGACLLIIGAILWNKLFLATFQESVFLSDIFRRAHRTAHSPMYGKRNTLQSPWGILPILTAVALLWGIARRPEAVLPSRALLRWLLLFQVVMAVSIASFHHFNGQAAPLDAPGSQDADLTQFSGVGDLLRSYVSKMPDLSPRQHHYPPGILLIWQLQRLIGARYLAIVISVLLPALTLVPLAGLAAESGLDPSATGAAMILFCTSANLLVAPLINTMAIWIFPATMTLWMLARGLAREDVGSAVLAGVCFAIYVLGTFAAYMLLGLMVLWLTFSIPRVGMRRVMMVAGLSATAFCAFYLILYAASGFNILACFRAATRLHLLQSGSGFDTLGRYLLRSTGGILAYLIAVGFPVSVLGYAALNSTCVQSGTGALLRPFAWATALAIILSGFSGMTFLETERIWIFFSPPLAVVAGYELERRRRREGNHVFVGTVLLALTFSCLYLLYWDHTVRPHRAVSPPQDPPVLSPAQKE